MFFYPFSIKILIEDDDNFGWIFANNFTAINDNLSAICHH
jgi:hypothetical protein